MIISGVPDKKGDNRWIYLFYLLVLLLIVKLLVSIIGTKADSDNGGLSVYCDAENVKAEYFFSSGDKFSGGNQQSDERYRSGGHSVKLDSNYRYGFEYVIENPLPGKRYRVSAWSLNPDPTDAYLVASSSTGDDFYKISSQKVERDPKFWDRRELTVQIPSNKRLDLIKFYVYKDKGPNPIYFDDFSVEEIQASEMDSGKLFVPDSLHLTIDRSGLDYIENIKNKSIQQGLVYKDGSNIKVKFRSGSNLMNGRLRLKGDWLDHIFGYISYRLELDAAYSWKGMQSFSVQEPSTRGYVRNWVFSQIMKKEDILYPRTDFFWMIQNEGDPFVFSYEEHFTKNLVESQNRREGPIVKLTEDKMWETTKRYIKTMNQTLPGIDQKDKAYWASEIKAFKEKKTLNNPVLKNNFEIAQNLMHQFKYDLKPASEIFDLDRLARYMALVDICLAKHAITWHNQRFYFNPVTGLLEPIAFDSYTSEDPDIYAGKILHEEIYEANTLLQEPMEMLLFDDGFVPLYFDYLTKFSAEGYMESILDALDEGISERETFIRNRIKSYTYDREEIINKAKRIRVALDAVEGSLRVYKTEGTNLELANYHSVPLVVYLDDVMSDSIIVYPHNYNTNPYFEKIDGRNYLQSKYIKYRTAGSISIKKANIYNYDRPQSFSPRQELTRANIEEFADAFDFVGDKVILKDKKLILDRILVVPREKRMVVPAGSEIEMNADAFILSYAPVSFMGTEDEPIQFICNDCNSGSLFVLQAEGDSEIRYTRFENQGTISYKNWQLTGAVTFYESNVTISNTEFVSNRCEDALNIIRSEFDLGQSRFVDTYGDAFDADFCTGTVTDSYFVDIGNDAIDVSGSMVSISNTIVDRAGDKGVSVGEASNVSASNTDFRNTNIGFASKDKSILKVDNVKIENAQTGFTAFQKKPEYGPSEIILGKVNMTNVKREYMIESSSKLSR